MKRLAVATFASLLVVGLFPLSAGAQMYEPEPVARYGTVYCSGFVAATPVESNLRVVMGEDGVGHQIYSLYDYIYLDRGSDGGVRPGQRFLIIRPWNDVTAPEAEAFQGEHKLTRQFGDPWYKKQYVGQYYQDIGQLEVKYVYPTKSTAQITYTCDAPMVGDFLIPYEERPQPEFKPTNGFDRFAPPSGKAIGRLLPGKDFGHAFGEGHVLYVVLGTNDGVVVGDYVSLFRAATGSEYRGVSVSQRQGADHPLGGHWKRYRGVPEGVEIPEMPPDLPREVLGEALVLRVEEKTATAIVTHSVREIMAGDYAELQPPAPPLAQITVSPDTINRGETATLSWNARLAQQIQITGLGAVSDRKGTVNVNPTQTTTYTMAVSGRGGQAQDAATLTVIQPPPPPPPPPPGPTLEELFAQYVQDIFFEFDRDEITPQASAKLERVAVFLRDNPEARILIEGHCDEIGSDKYNIRLGARRAEVTKNHLVALGANPAQLDGVSRGRTQQFCSESRAEPCRQLNRRAHFVLLR
jgi:outer membrane protein OmpA-like peptidoglycan-associated protein